MCWWKESNDDWMIKEWRRNVDKGFWTKRVSKKVLNGTMIVVNWLFEWNENKSIMSIPKMKSMPNFDKISENGRNIYEWNQINQTILDIDFDWTFPNEPGSLTFWRLGISRSNQFSIFQNTFQSHWTRFIETTSIRIRIDNGCQIWKI